ncbi:unnamed protein product [Pocillopora meandrina]|uniref:Cytochrome c oxidase assembly factor 5 n=1 Tax=Pocillopora meandrina TaxID=46732 RepID=A0AAU9WTY9_9CNID|nr:unnamed protein product [Pocillopora meandrina]
MQLDEEDIENQKPQKPCSGLRKELKDCILASDCVKKVKFVINRLPCSSTIITSKIYFYSFLSFMNFGSKPNDCLNPDAQGINENCRRVQYAFFECKRSLVRMLFWNLFQLFSHPFQGKKRILMEEHRNVVFSGLDNQ